MEYVFRSATVHGRFILLHALDGAGALIDHWTPYGAIRGIYINPRRQPDGYNTLVVTDGYRPILRVAESPEAIMVAVDSCLRLAVVTPDR